MSNQQTQHESPALRYQNEWDRNTNPNLHEFLNTCGSIPTSDLSEVLRIDLRQRWQRKESPPVENYLNQFPELASDAESTIDLIYTEYLIRESEGEVPSVEEFAERFPSYAKQLVSQIQIHHLVDSTEMHTASKTIGLHGSSPTIISCSSGILSGTFGRYQIQRLLGHGGMGDVYLATDTVLHRSVALKIPKLHLDRDPDIIKRFYREARAAANLRHPNICAVFDVGEIDGRHFLTMEYIEGETLSALIQRQGKLAVEQAIHIIRPVLDAMQMAHHNGILHRDLKPSNIMIDIKNQPIIMDFGLAQFQSSDESHITAGGDFLGTPAFASPEQLRGQSELIGPASDVYSLGAILFQILTGQPPFVGNVAVVIKSALDEPAPKPSDLNPEVSATLDAICQRALAKLPQDRFSSTSEFANAFTSISQDIPDSTQNNLANRVPKQASTRRLMFRLAMLAVLAICGIVVSVPAIRNSQKPLLAAIPMPIGSVWRGEFAWDGASSDRHSAQLTVTERNEAHLQAQYVTEDKFAWTVSGSLIDDQLELRFIKNLITGEPQSLIETGRLAGKLDGNSINVVFSDSSDMSTTSFVLHRVPDKP